MQQIIKICLITSYMFLLISPSASMCPCTKEWMPVCGTNLRTYANKCLAMCAGVEISRPGACRSRTSSRCTCPFYYDPVCGVDGITYKNDCLLMCAGVMQASEGACIDPISESEESCICPTCLRSRFLDPTLKSMATCVWKIVQELKLFTKETFVFFKNNSASEIVS